jgi:RND family efflux transporter MFP subunit
VTQRYANLGTLMQAGTHSSTQALPLVQLSQDDKFRLVIPVPESYVGYIRVGDPVDVRVPSLNQHFPGRVARFSFDVKSDTRTMHTEVDVPNPRRVLMPGVYAEATLTISRGRALAIPLEAVTVEGDLRRVWVVGPSNKVDLRNVALGIEMPEDAEVLSGVSDGDRVAVGERSNLRVGEAVCPKEVQLIRYRSDQP